MDMSAMGGVDVSGNVYNQHSAKEQITGHDLSINLVSSRKIAVINRV